jgi:deoxyxylulose-5-phosphate synthase
MGCVPGMACLQPATEAELRACMDWAVDAAPGPVYLRIASVPWELGFDPPPAAPLAPGRGTVVRPDGDVVAVCTGPVPASQVHAVEHAAVVLLPWLRDVDGTWLADVAGGRPVAVVEDHWVRGGQGDAVRAALPGHDVRILGIDSLPASGGNADVLRAHGLDAAALRERLR